MSSTFTWRSVPGSAGKPSPPATLVTCCASTMHYRSSKSRSHVTGQPDVTMWTGGGKAQAATAPVQMRRSRHQTCLGRHLPWDGGRAPHPDHMHGTPSAPAPAWHNMHHEICHLKLRSPHPLDVTSTGGGGVRDAPSGCS